MLQSTDRAKGAVIIMFDLSSRTGAWDNRCKHQQLAEWELAGVPAPPALVSLSAHAAVAGCRNSIDACFEHKMGGCMISFVRGPRDHGLLILNGRLQDDEHGACTYCADGRNGRRLVI